MIKLFENLSDIPPLDQRLWSIKECTGCHLSPHLGENSFCKQVVVGDGNLDGKVLFVLMVPGATENEYGHAAIGVTGSKLKNWLRQLGIDPYTVGFWTNALMCAFPPERTKNKSKNKAEQRELDACKKNLSQIIQAMKNLKLVCCFGAEAVRAVVGKGTRIKDIIGNLMRFTWEPALFSQEEKQLHAFALYHPSFVVRQDGYAKRQTEMAYQWQLKLLQQIILNIDNIEKLKPQGRTIIAGSEQEVETWVKRHLYDNRIQAYVKDFETLGAQGWYSKAICDATAYYDPDEKSVVSFVVPLLQCVDLPKEQWYHTRLRKTLSRFEMKWQWTDWFSTGFYERYGKMIRPLFDARTPLPEGRERPQVGAYHMGFDRNCSMGSFGYPLCGNEKQFVQADLNEVLPYDFMCTMRLCGSQNSMKLENILKIVLPMVADEKGIVDKILSRAMKDATGFGLLARKLPEKYQREDVISWANDYKHYLSQMEHARGKRVKKELQSKSPLTEEQLHIVNTYYSLEADDFLSDILFERAGFDARKEFELWGIGNKILDSPDEFALFNIGKENSLDELFLNEEFEETLAQLSELGVTEQI